MPNKYVDFVLRDSDETLKRNINATPVSYADSNVKARLDEIYTDELPSDLKTIISPISKKYYKYDGTIEIVTAPLWLLNTKDVNLTGSYLKETEGEEYSLFDTNTKRSKYFMNDLSRYSWWLGSAYSSDKYVVISNSGDPNNNSSTYYNCLIFGFRIQKTI